MTVDEVGFRQWADFECLVRNGGSVCKILRSGEKGLAFH
jgi:hypothetical protein